MAAITLSATVAGTPYYQYRTISLSVGQIPVSRDSYIGASILYESISGRVGGLDTTNPSEKFEVYNGRVKADGKVFTSSEASILPQEIKFKGGRFKAALADGIEKTLGFLEELQEKLQDVSGNTGVGKTDASLQLRN